MARSSRGFARMAASRASIASGQRPASMCSSPLTYCSRHVWADAKPAAPATSATAASTVRNRPAAGRARRIAEIMLEAEDRRDGKLSQLLGEIPREIELDAGEGD